MPSFPTTPEEFLNEGEVVEWLKAAKLHHPDMGEELQYVVFNHYAGLTLTRYASVEAFLVSSWPSTCSGPAERKPHTCPRQSTLNFVTGHASVCLDGYVAGS